MAAPTQTPNPLTAIDYSALLGYAPLAVNILSALGIFILGWIVSRWASKTINTRLSDHRGLEVSPTIRPLIVTTVRYAILLAALYAALTTAGIPASSLLAVLGAAGLAIALAVQGTLSNIAAGIMLIFLKVFKVGEYIEGPNAEGTVLELGLFTTQIKRPDGVRSIVPNAQIWGSRVNNFSRHSIRRVDIDIDIARDNDVEAAMAALDTKMRDQDVLTEPDLASVIISGFKPNAVTLQVRCWLHGANYRADCSLMRAALHKALQDGKFKLPPIPLAEAAV